MPAYVLAPHHGLEVYGVRNAGDAHRERVLFRVLEPTNLVQYLVVDASTREPHAIVDRNEHVFWFPEVEVEPGDMVRLYSRAGRSGSKMGKISGEPARIFDFFWSKDRPVWEGRSNAVVLVEIAEWRVTRV